MAVADPERELASVFRWGASLAGTYLAWVFVGGLLFIALSAPTLHLAPIAYPQSVPFLWLSIVGLTIGLLDPNLNEEDAELLNKLMSNYRTKNSREKFIYLTSFVMIGIGSISFEVAVVGIASTLIAESLGLGLLAVAVALWYPATDAWLGRTLGWNVASTGGLITLLVMGVVAVLYQVSPEVPRSAAMDIRRSLVTH